MREIKFRAWDIERDHMESDDRVVKLWMARAADPENMDGPIHLMQYTGLKDMHGIAICEGDILEYVSQEHQEDDRRDLYEVEWKGFGFEARWATPPSPQFTADGRMSLMGCDEDMMVIGNIYENPELLEAGDAA